jgi:transposase-like protein
MEKTEKGVLKMEGKKGRKNSFHTAEEKCRAVLSVWTEKRKAAEVCRELGIAWTLLNQWEARAMEGILQALGSRVRMEKTVALSPRLAVLLDKKVQQGSMKGLERRLASLQSKTRFNERNSGKPEDSQEIGA